MNYHEWGRKMELPRGWTTVSLSDICVQRKEKILPSESTMNLFIGLEHIEAQTMKLLSTADISSVKSSSMKFYANDILYGRLRPYLNKVLLAGLDGICSSELIIFPIQKNLNNGYLAYHLNSMRFVAYAMSKVTGDRPRIDFETMSAYELLLPPLAEQHRIVEKIDTLFSKLDKGVEMLKIIRQQLQTYRQAVLKWAFEGKLSNDTIKDYGRLQDLCFFITKGTTPHKTVMTADYGDVPFIKVYNLTLTGELDFTINPTFVSHETHNGFLARSKIFPGDVLMNIVGPPLGKVSIAPNSHKEFNINQAIARFRCNDELYNKFLAYFLMYSGTIEMISKKSKATAGQLNLTLEICRDIEIPLLDISTQKKIVTEIESRLSVCDKLESIVDENLAKSESLRQSILKKAFSGQLVPQNPSDEPANKLLERIKAERQTSSSTQKPARRKKNA